MVLDSGLSVGADLASQFGMDFVQDIAADLLREAGFGLAIAWIPILGGIVSASFDAAIALKMTRRVGTMISIYYQNGRSWVGSRRETYGYAKDITGKKDDDAGVDLNSVRFRVPAVHEYQVRQLMRFVRDLLEAAPKVKDETILAILRKKGVADDLAEEVLRRACR